ncbi:FecR domain-containing protein [Phenylobacterium sp. 20VBR1]|uniref:FecR domain-containing protein n=1 Tax=Phenylobacterium glaciei TaxID=2803784 RepID=A0A941HVZ6_9CAUL|nr:FecR domain-containing protein [Phenylobacterium glaciei]MBR7619248.1 FecR domain-containing protein [Phenylobacterium glaciei]
MIGELQDRAQERLAQASDWIARLQADDLTEADGLAFDSWLGATPDNARAYDQALAVWNAVGASSHDIVLELTRLERRRARQGLGRRWLVGAGSLAAAAALVVVVLPSLASKPATETYATANGQHRVVTLADGSKIELNAETQLAVTLGRDERRVVMGEGEAIFDVAADRDRPFTIATGHQVVRVVGTQFDVRNRQGGVAVTVARGVVEVGPAPNGAPGRTYVLRPGQRLAIGGGRATRLSTIEPAVAFSWRTGRVVYRDEPLSNVVADLNRQFAKPILIADVELGRTPISGVLVMDSQSDVVRRLALMLPIAAIDSPEGVVLHRK